MNWITRDTVKTEGSWEITGAVGVLGMHCSTTGPARTSASCHSLDCFPFQELPRWWQRWWWGQWLQSSVTLSVLQTLEIFSFEISLILATQ